MRRPQFTPIAALSVEHYPAGKAALSPEPGDFIVTHGSSLISRLIRFGEALRVHGTDRQFTYWNHAAQITGPGGSLVQAMGSGVQRGSLSDYTSREYYLVRIIASDEDRAEVVAFADWAANAHARYGWLTIASITLSVLTGCKLTFFIDGEFICSGLVARAQERTTALFSLDPVHITPADLAKYYNVPGHAGAGTRTDSAPVEPGEPSTAG
jgi:hypothetical protein